MIFSYLLNMQSHPSWVCGLKLALHLVRLDDVVSHPSWVCGLKQTKLLCRRRVPNVTPFVGVWIETPYLVRLSPESTVTPFVGVWIETDKGYKYEARRVSHPSWVCGLKQSSTFPFRCLEGHTLRGCVDWNIKNGNLGKVEYVTPFVGVWIETLSPYGWYNVRKVTPFVGVWIET